MTSPRKDEGQIMKSAEEIALSILTQFCEVEAYRDGLVVNDLPFLRSLIAKALTSFAEARVEKAEDALKQNFKHIIADLQLV